MATFKKNGLGLNQFGGFTPYGNLTTLRAAVIALATGAIDDSSATKAPAVGDKLHIQVLPAGFRCEDAQVIVSTAFKAGVTATLGFEYVDGVNDADVPQDAAYFGLGLVLSAAARLRTASAKAPVTLPKEAFLVLTLTGVANDQAARLDVIVHGERLGDK